MTYEEQRQQLREEYSVRIAEAQAKEQEERDSAYVEGVNPEICGHEIRDLSLTDFNILSGMGSPFVVGGIPDREDVFLFLWFMSPGFSRSRLKKFLYRFKLRNVDGDMAVKEIRDYVRSCFGDFGGSGEMSEDPAKASFIGHCVHRFASAYGWSRKDILASPLRQLMQQQRIITVEMAAQAGKHHHFLGGQVDRLHSELLTKLTEINQREADGV